MEPKGEAPDVLDFIGDNAASLKASPSEVLDTQVDVQVEKVLRILSKVVYSEVLADFFKEEQFGTRRSIRLPARKRSSHATEHDPAGSVASNLALKQPKYTLYEPVLVSSLEEKRNPLLSARNVRDLRRSPRSDEQENSVSP